MPSTKFRVLKLRFNLILVFATIFAIFPNVVLGQTKEILVKVNGKAIQMDIKPFIQKDSIFVPIRFISEALDGKVSWEKEENRITIIKGDKEIKLWVGYNKGIISGDEKAPFLKDGRTFVPLRFVAQNLDCIVDWNGATRTVTINAQGYVEKPKKENEVKLLSELNITPQPVSVLGKPKNDKLSLISDTSLYYNPGTQQTTKKTKVNIINKSDLPIKFGDRIIYDLKVQEDKFIVVQQRTKGENNPMPMKIFEDGLGKRIRAVSEKKYDGDICTSTYLARSASDFDMDPNYYYYNLKKADYFIFDSELEETFVAIKNPLE